MKGACDVTVWWFFFIFITWLLLIDDNLHNILLGGNVEKTWKLSIIQTAINHKSMDAAQCWTLFFFILSFFSCCVRCWHKSPSGGPGSQGGPLRSTRSLDFNISRPPGTRSGRQNLQFFQKKKRHLTKTLPLPNHHGSQTEPMETGVCVSLFLRWQRPLTFNWWMVGSE